MTENGLDVSDGYVLMKNGYFWRPNSAGYTSHLADAGIYSDEESRLRCANPDVTRERYVDALARRLPPADNAVAVKPAERVGQLVSQALALAPAAGLFLEITIKEAAHAPKT